MPFDELKFKSKAQAEKLRGVFVKRYGKEKGLIKYDEVAKRSPKLEDLPDQVEMPVKTYSKKRINISRKWGKKWRGV